MSSDSDNTVIINRSLKGNIPGVQIGKDQYVCASGHRAGIGLEFTIDGDVRGKGLSLRIANTPA